MVLRGPFHQGPHPTALRKPNFFIKQPYSLTSPWFTVGAPTPVHSAPAEPPQAVGEQRGN